MYSNKNKNFLSHWDFMLIDLLCLIAAFQLSMLLRFGAVLFFWQEEKITNMAVIIFLSEIFSSITLNNLHMVLRRDEFQEVTSILALACATGILSIVYFYVSYQASDYSRLILLYTLVLFIPLCFLARTFLKRWLRRRLKNGKKRREETHRVLVLSDEQHAQEILLNLREDTFTRYQVCGVALLGESTDQRKSLLDVPVVGGPEKAAEYICREWVDEVFVQLPYHSEATRLFFSRCAEMGITVHSVLNIQETAVNKQMIEYIGGQTVLTTAYSFMSAYQKMIKRCFDILGGLVGSILTVLIGIIIGPMIYIHSPGPILFRQTRVGKNGKQFKIYKFRSMYLDAEERKKELMAQNRLADGMMFKIEHDPRIIGNRQMPDGTWKTGIGEFIRRTSLDEFPQFFNVLKGDMSLVGTRPPTLDEWEKYKFHHRARLSMKPGITGMWQVSGRSKITDFEEVVRLDTEYITKYRLSLDLKIILKTVLVVIKHDGSM